MLVLHLQAVRLAAQVPSRQQYGAESAGHCTFLTGKDPQSMQTCLLPTKGVGLHVLLTVQQWPSGQSEMLEQPHAVALAAQRPLPQQNGLVSGQPAAP